MNILTLTNISKTITDEKERLEVLENVSFEIVKEKFTTLIGPSGSGKSTLLRIISGLTKETSGKIHWLDQKPKISFVFQNFALFPYLTVLENIGFGLKVQGQSPKERQKKVTELIKEVGLEGFEDKHPKELSGGMKQRVGIARALAVEPDLLLLDEPFSALDEFTAQNLRELLLQIWQDRKMTIFMVTHLITEALELSDQIFILTRAPGKVEKIIDCNLPRPRNLRSEHFFKLEDELKALIQI